MARRQTLLSLLALAVLAAPAAPRRNDDGSARFAPLAIHGLLLGAVRADSRLVAVGEFGHVVLSDDLGKTWRQAERVPTRTTLTAVTFTDATHGWAVGHGGQILATSDGGETWVVQTGAMDGTDSLFSVWFEDPLCGFAVGPFGYAVATQDGGKTWTQFHVADGEDGERHLNGLFAGRAGRILIAAEIGGVFVSDDSGRHWRLVNLPYEGSLWGGMPLTDGSLVVWGMAGHALRSLDNGETWTELATHTEQSLTAGIQFTDGHLALVGLGGVVTVADRNFVFEAVTREDRQPIAAVLNTDVSLLLFTAAGIVTHRSVEAPRSTGP